jgi:hypothetical protein
MSRLLGMGSKQKSLRHAAWRGDDDFDLTDVRCGSSLKGPEYGEMLQQ